MVSRVGRFEQYGARRFPEPIETRGEPGIRLERLRQHDGSIARHGELRAEYRVGQFDGARPTVVAVFIF